MASHNTNVLIVVVCVPRSEPLPPPLCDACQEAIDIYWVQPSMTPTHASKKGTTRSSSTVDSREDLGGWGGGGGVSIC